MCFTVWYRRCWRSAESLADQHKREHTQTVPGKRPAEAPRVFPANLILFLSPALLVSSRLLPVISVFVCFSITVTVAKSVLALTLADVAVPQQDSSWLCLRGLLVSHCYCRSVHRQQVSSSVWLRVTVKHQFYYPHIGRLVLADNFIYEAKHCGVFFAVPKVE